jgi:phosphoglycerate dehydrogenase-like enzyme
MALKRVVFNPMILDVHGSTSYSFGMVFLVPADLEPSLLHPLPAGLELATLAKDGTLSTNAKEAEFVLAPYGGAKHMFPLLPQMPNIKVIQTFTAGVDWIVDKIPAHITLCDAAGVHDIPVSEWIMAGILGAYKRFPEFRDFQREQRWAYQFTEDLEGSSILFLGYGSIAKATERRLAPFEVSFIKVARTAREDVYAFSELLGLLPKADIVINLLPHTPETHRLFSAEHVAAMKQGAVYVNAGRGRTVDQDALVAAIKAQQIRLVTDVSDPEPLPEGHALWSLPGVFITPHIAGSTPKLYQRGVKLALEQLNRYIRGEPLINVVNRAYGY